MIGDAQLKKRREKKKKKDDGQEEIISQHHATTSPSIATDDLNIHVHKEPSTGGGLCAKLIFIVLLTILSTLIGLIINEHRGASELDTLQPESRYAQIFEGWLDTPATNEFPEYDANEEHLEEEINHSHDVDDEDDDHTEENEQSEEKEAEDNISDEEDTQEEDITYKSEEEEEEEQEESNIPEEDSIDNEDEDDSQEDVDEIEESQERDLDQDEDKDSNQEEYKSKDELQESDEIGEKIEESEENPKLLDDDDDDIDENDDDIQDDNDDDTEDGELEEDIYQKDESVNKIESISSENVGNVKVARVKSSKGEIPKKDELENLNADEVNYANSLKVPTLDSDSENEENDFNRHSGAQNIYDFSNITNIDDWKIREDLDRAHHNLANE